MGKEPGKNLGGIEGWRGVVGLEGKWEGEEPGTDGRKELERWRRGGAAGIRGKGKINGQRSGNDRLTRAAEERVWGRHVVEERGEKERKC